MESVAHAQSSFLTLTYSEEALPKGNTLSNEHWREFTKGIGYRYFGCGEYGEHFGRPHYHVILFGIAADQAEALALSRWRYGFVSSRPFCFEHAAYVASYTVKKLNKPGVEGLSEGQAPEFARMSRRPAIGSPGIVPFQRWLVTSQGASYLAKTRDVPPSIRVSGAFYPLGRTLVTKLREACDIPADDVVRNERRRAQFRLESSIPELVALKENRRVDQYLRQKYKRRNKGGIL